MKAERTCKHFMSPRHSLLGHGEYYPPCAGLTITSFNTDVFYTRKVTIILCTLWTPAILPDLFTYSLEERNTSTDLIHYFFIIIYSWTAPKFEQVILSCPTSI